MDIGATQFTFLVLSNQSIIYSVEQPFGGRQLTEDIQRHYNLTWAEAGRAKRKGGLDADYDEAMLNPLVLGGIFQSEELTGDEKVPLLGDLPLVGGLFKKQMRSKDKREILIFITPKIIDNR